MRGSGLQVELTETVPAAHGLHVTWPDRSPYEPPGQARQVTAAAVSVKKPTGQVVHSLSPDSDDDPIGHASHEVLPASDVTLPAGHATQKRPPTVTPNPSLSVGFSVT